MIRNKLIMVSAVVVVLLFFVSFSVFSRITAQGAQAQQWEYMSIDYSQHQTFGDNEEYVFYETVSSDTLFYNPIFAGFITEGCTITMDSLYFDLEAQKCVAKNFKGRQFYMNLVGLDGWELVQVDNVSTQYIYRLDILFKRPLNTSS